MARAASRRSKPTVSRRTASLGNAPRGTAPRPSARRPSTRRPSTSGKPRSVRRPASAPRASARRTATGRAAPASARRPPVRLDPATVSSLFDKLALAIPEPKSELRYASPFELLVAVILSAQATDKSVNLATQRLYPDAHTPQAILALGEAGLLAYIRTIGLAPTKARNIVATCRLLLERHAGQVPATRAALEALPGVGRKTANVVLNTAFGEPTLAVDTHVFRVANRTGLARGKTPLQVEEGLLAVVPPRHLQHAHHLLILHGRYTCTARRPACPACPIRAECAWPEKTEG